MKMRTHPENYESIHAGIVGLLKSARSAAARNVNSIMTAVYWDFGRRIVKFEQGGERRAEYGEQLVEQLARDLTRQFGRGFGRANLWQMRGFYLAWPEAKILQTPSGESTDDSSTVLALASHFRLPWSAGSSAVLQLAVTGVTALRTGLESLLLMRSAVGQMSEMAMFQRFSLC